jgi:hypothetical protein
MATRQHPGSEMPAPGEGRPLGGQLDTLDALFDFQSTFNDAVNRVTSPESHTRGELHELVCIVATRLHVERSVLAPLASSVPGGDDYQSTRQAVHHRIEQILSLIDRRAASDPQMPSLFKELQDVVRSNNASQQVLFSGLRAGLSESKAQRLRMDLQAAVDTAMTRPHPHLPHNGPLGGWARAVAARIDRLRNRAPVR